MSDYVDKLLQDANEIRVIRACHACQHHEGYGEPYENQWCSQLARISMKRARKGNAARIWIGGHH